MYCFHVHLARSKREIKCLPGTRSCKDSQLIYTPGLQKQVLTRFTPFSLAGESAGYPEMNGAYFIATFMQTFAFDEELIERIFFQTGKGVGDLEPEAKENWNVCLYVNFECVFK